LKSRRLATALVVAGVCSIWTAACHAETSPVGPSKSPRLEVSPHSIGRAKQIAVKVRDLPNGWTSSPNSRPASINHTFASPSCPGVAPDLSTVVFRGGWGPDFLYVQDARWELRTAVSILGSSPEAALFYHASIGVLSRRCLDRGAGLRLAYVRLAPLPLKVGEAIRAQALWVPLKTRGMRIGWDVLLIHEGPVMATLLFMWTGKPISHTLEADLARKVAARAGM
jgi:hypothetical protein